MSEKHTLTRDFFRLWLERCEPDAVVWGVRESRGCPIAKYMEWEVGGSWYVNSAHYRRGMMGERMGLPAWARHFVAAIDSGGEHVTASECLEVLDKIAPDDWAGVTA
jgi:hypothetical protein